MPVDFYERMNPKKKEPETPDFYARIKEEEPEEIPDFYARAEQEKEEKEKPHEKPGIFENFGKALSYQMKSGGPAGAPSLSPEQAKSVAIDVATQSAVSGVFAPIKYFATLAPYLRRSLGFVTGVTEAAVTGAAVPTAHALVEGGEMPSKEELLEHGAMWAGIDIALQALHLGTEFSTTVNQLSKEYGIPRYEVIKRLWRGAKNYYGWGKNKIDPETGAEIILPEQIEAVTAMAEKEPETIMAEAERIPEPKPEKVAEVEVKPTEVVETPKPEVKKPKEELPEKSVVKEEPKPTSGYERKPTPVTVPEKIAHLTQKIEESSHHVSGVNLKLQDARQAVQEHKKNKPPKGNSTLELAAQKIYERKLSSLENHVDNLSSEKESESEYGKQLKKDLKDLKTKGEASKVEVPLGYKPQAKKPPGPRSKNLTPLRPKMGKAQAVKRSKILDLFRKAFKNPIRLGKIANKRALGIHKSWTAVSRLLKANDIETAAHEIGHHLHYILYEGTPATPTEQQLNVNRALNPYLGELKPLALYEPYAKEGFAEFVRLYVTNPDVAQQMAPKFYGKFEADLDVQAPDLKNALLEARDYYDQYIQGTPESRIRAQTDYGEDTTKLENLTDWVKSNLNLDNLKTQFLDDVFPAKRLVAEAFDIPLSEVENLKDPRNLYRSLRVLKGAVGKAEVFLTHQTFDPITLKRKGRGLRQILRKLKTPEEYKEFNDYLIARRVNEKNAQGIETGISLGDAIMTERKYGPKYKKLALLLDQYADALLSYARDCGLISTEGYQLIKKNNMMYVPFQRNMGKEKGEVGSTSGKLQARNPIKEMKGSTRNIIAPVESFIKNTYAIILNSEKNLSAQVLGNLAAMKGVGRFVEHVPIPTKLKAKISREEVLEQMEKMLKKSGWMTVGGGGLGSAKLEEFALELADVMPDFFVRFGAGTYPAGENIITVFNNGKPTYYEVSPELYEMWSKGIAPYTANIITKILRIPARTLRAGAILNPKFMLKNVVRDTWGSWLFTKYGKSVKDPVGMFIDTLYSPFAMLAVASKQAKLYVQWMKAGGGMSTMQSMDREGVVKKLKEVRDGYSPHQVIKMLRKVSEISEEANRLAEFGRALKVEGDTRLGHEIAAFASRDLSIDFAKMGLQTKALNQIIPFWNATVQGSDKFFRTLASDKDRLEFIARIIGFIAIPSLILAWLNQDDERVDEFYEEEKDFNFITFIGGTALKIPVPFETGVMAHGLMQRMYKYFIKEDPKAFEGFMGSIASAMLPNFIPSFANPVIETAANKNFFTGAPIVPQSKKNLIAKYQYKNTTSLTARLLGRAVAYMLGQDTRSQAASPAVIDHFINSWGAGMGRLIVSASDASLEAAGLGDKVEKPDRTIVEKLGLDAFVARYPRSSTRSIEKFYEYYADATARQKSIKYAKKMELESDEEIQKAYERIERLYSYKDIQRAYKAMQLSQKAINNIWNDPEIDKDLKKQMIDDLYEQQIQFARAANKDIEEYIRLNK